MTDRQADARNDRIFREARRRVELEIKAIISRNAAKGLLKSGATLKEIVRAFDETTIVGLAEALDGIATVTPRTGTKRRRLLQRLQASLAYHQREAVRIAREAIERIGLGNDFKHAAPFIDEAVARHRDKIADFGEGWTAPTVKPFKEQHPYIYDGFLLLLGCALGFASQPLADRLFHSQGGDGPKGSMTQSFPRQIAPLPSSRPDHRVR